MQTDKKKIVAKIAKCLALSQSPEPHEAAAALKRAQELMEKHQVSEQEVRLSDVQTRRSSAGRAVDCPPIWLTGLANVVCDAFGVEGFFNPNTWEPASFTFVGLDPAVDFADYTFTVLRRKCTAARSAYYKRLRGKRVNRIRKADAYALGWVNAVYSTVQTFAKTAPQVVGEYLQVHHSELAAFKPNNRTTEADNKHQLMGYLDGSGVDIHQGVAAQERRQIG